MWRKTQGKGGKSNLHGSNFRNFDFSVSQSSARYFELRSKMSMTTIPLNASLISISYILSILYSEKELNADSQIYIDTHIYLFKNKCFRIYVVKSRTRLREKCFEYSFPSKQSSYLTEHIA